MTLGGGEADGLGSLPGRPNRSAQFRSAEAALLSAGMSTNAVRVLFACVLCAAIVTAQRRAPLLGVVRDAAGAAVARATVMVIEDDPDLAGIDPVDVLEATTDTRGRFKVDALCGVR